MMAYMSLLRSLSRMKKSRGYEAVDSQLRRIVERSWQLEEVRACSLLQRYDLAIDFVRSDSEIASIAEAEVREVDHEFMSLLEDLERTIKVDEADDNSCGVLELRAGTGGTEAAMFAKQLLDVYLRTFALLDAEYSVGCSGKNDSEFLVQFSGKSVFKYVRLEAGIHRVQRIPKTEKLGRVHTSTVSVAVVPGVSFGDVEFDAKDLRFESLRSSGPGGQSANVSNSAVRVTHVPSGLSVLNQEERSNVLNRGNALRSLKERLLQSRLKGELGSIAQQRREQIRMCHRSDKIRTYNEAHNRIIDHSLDNYQGQYSSFMEGRLLYEILKRKRIRALQHHIDSMFQG